MQQSTTLAQQHPPAPIYKELACISGHLPDNGKPIHVPYSPFYAARFKYR